jgi:hypothetical protein
MVAPTTPISASLVCDDPALIDIAEALIGGPTVPSVVEG